MSEMNINTTQEQKIRELAYNIWEKDGRPVGRALEHWLKAERSLNSTGGPAASAFFGAHESPGFASDPAEPASMALRLKPTAPQPSAPRKVPAKSTKSKKTVR